MENIQLELKESYNFNYNEKEKCYSFEFKNKKAFIIDLSKKENHNMITPYVIQRKHLRELSNKMFEQDKEEGFETSKRYIHCCMEIIGNLLDESKMGSIDNYLNHIWKEVNKFETYFDMLGFYSQVITMIDISVGEQCDKLGNKKLNEIHNAFIANAIENSIKGIRVFIGNEKGEFKQVFGIGETDDEPEQEYDLKHMTPLNTKEI